MTVAIKKFMRERSEKMDLIDELKGALMGRPGNKSKLKNGARGEDLMPLFMDVGRMAYRSGDSRIFDHWFRSTLEIVDNGHDDADTAELAEASTEYGLRTIRELDSAAFEVVTGAFADSTPALKEVVAIDRRLGILKDLAMRAASEGFEAGVREVVSALGILGKRFEEEGLDVSLFSLRSLVVSLVHSLKGHGDGSLRENVIADASLIIAEKDSLEGSNTLESQADTEIGDQRSPLI